MARPGTPGCPPPPRPLDPPRVGAIRRKQHDPFNGTAPAGDFAVAAPKPDMACRFMPYHPGEKLRPEAKISASATEGLTPLTVTFAGGGGARTRWGFGDGATSDAQNPTHTFQKPGLYRVTLTVTDPDGGSAQSWCHIALDRRTSYRAGPVDDDIGPLSIGNFNETMRGSAWTASFAAKSAPWRSSAAAQGNAAR